MENRETRDLPEVVADILIEQHAMREGITGMREEMRDGNAALRQEMVATEAANQRRVEESVRLFNSMTDSILDARNRGNDRYHGTNGRMNGLDTRVTKQESPDAP